VTGKTLAIANDDDVRIMYTQLQYNFSKNGSHIIFNLPYTSWTFNFAAVSGRRAICIALHLVAW